MIQRHVIVVENESLLRDLIARTLESAGYSVATAANAADAKRSVQAIDPDVVVLDIELGPGPNGFEFAESLARTNPEVGIVFMTNLPDGRFAGDEGHLIPKKSAYLRKSQLTDSQDLVGAIEAVISQRVGVQFRHDMDGTRPLAKLSRRQLGVLGMVAKGLSNAQIAVERGTTVRAVEGIISRIFEALELDTAGTYNTRVEAARTYLKATGNISGE
ncbi:MAG: hypothetical protein RL556_306 [Actinomycetota bacterium]|jgi:DNA-binding NarL/FixJ family response regulator